MGLQGICLSQGKLEAGSSANCSKNEGAKLRLRRGLILPREVCDFVLRGTHLLEGI